MNRFRSLVALATVAAAGAIATPAAAAAPVLTSLTEAIDTSTLLTAILAVGALMIGVALTVLAVRKVSALMGGK